MTLGCAIVGSGNIGTDLMHKVDRSNLLEVAAVVGIDPESEGLRLARDRGFETSTAGIDWIVENVSNIDVVFEATSAQVHQQHAPTYAEIGIRAIDLTPAKLGPAIVPPVNLGAHLEARNVNMITCGGQATVPIVYAVSSRTRVPYAEIVSSVASRSAGPGTRQNIDQFTMTTSDALVSLGGAEHGKAIIILNPAEPPTLMRNTVYCALGEDADRRSVEAGVFEMVERVSQYVPGYRLSVEPVFEEGDFATPGGRVGSRLVVLLEVEGAGDYIPPFAGNLDIMTASAVRVAEMIAQSEVEA